MSQPKADANRNFIVASWRCGFGKSSLLVQLSNNGPCTLCMEKQPHPQGVLGLLLGYNVVFFTAHLKGKRALAEVLAEVQSLLNIFELIAVMVLFVDLVLRFDHIESRWQVSGGRSGLCLTACCSSGSSSTST